jgi:intermembrane space import and assembly protein 40
MYASELDDDEDGVEEELRAREAAPSGDASAKSSTDSPDTTTTPSQSESEKPKELSYRESSSTTFASAHTGGEEGEEFVPKATHDATSK